MVIISKDIISTNGQKYSSIHGRETDCLTAEVRLKFLYLNRNMLCVNRVANRQKRTRAAYQNINFNTQL